MLYAVLIAAVLLNVLVDFMDRVSVRGHDYRLLALWTAVIQFLLILPFVGLVDLLPLWAIGLCASVGAFSAFGRMLWYRALDRHGAALSRLTPFVHFSGIMAIAGAYFILREPLPQSAFIGGALIVLGSFVVMLDRPSETLSAFLKSNTSAMLVLVFAASMSAIAIMYKYLLNAGLALFAIYFFLKLFQAAAMLLTFALYRRGIAMHATPVAHTRMFVLGRAIQTLTALAYLFVLSGLELALVEPIVALSPLVVLALEFLGLDRRMGASERETDDGGRRVLVMRILAILLVIAGALLMSGWRP